MALKRRKFCDYNECNVIAKQRDSVPNGDAVTDFLSSDHANTKFECTAALCAV